MAAVNVVDNHVQDLTKIETNNIEDGYTSSAKKNAVKSRHDMLVKLYKAEFEKCNVGEKVNLLNNTVDICPYVLDPNFKTTGINSIRIYNPIKQSTDQDHIRLLKIYLYCI